MDGITILFVEFMRQFLFLFLFFVGGVGGGEGGEGGWTPLV